MGGISLWHWIILGGFALLLGLGIAAVAVALTMWREKRKR